MPFNLAQIFGGWRRKEAKKAPRAALLGGEPRSKRGPEVRRSPASAGLSASGANEASRDAARGAKPKGQSEIAGLVLVSPHISEKAAMLGEERVVFKVAAGAGKPAIKQAVENRYGVGVEAVNILAKRDKNRRRGAILGVKPGFKKAVVTLKAGDKITGF